MKFPLEIHINDKWFVIVIASHPTEASWLAWQNVLPTRARPQEEHSSKGINYPSKFTKGENPQLWHLQRKPLARSQPHPWRPLTLTCKQNITFSLPENLSPQKKENWLLIFFRSISILFLTKTRKSILFHFSTHMPRHQKTADIKIRINNSSIRSY